MTEYVGNANTPTEAAGGEAAPRSSRIFTTAQWIQQQLDTLQQELTAQGFLNGSREQAMQLLCQAQDAGIDVSPWEALRAAAAAEDAAAGHEAQPLVAEARAALVAALQEEPLPEGSPRLVDREAAAAHLRAVGFADDDLALLVAFGKGNSIFYAPGKGKTFRQYGLKDKPDVLWPFEQQAADFKANPVRAWDELEAQAERYAKQNGPVSLGFISAPGGTSTLRGEITHSRVVVLEVDDWAGLSAEQSLHQQLTSWISAGLPVPTLMMFTGSRSLHLYWVIDQLEPFAVVKQLRIGFSNAIKLAHGITTDLSLNNIHQPLRLAGTKHPKTGRVSRFLVPPGRQYTLEELKRHLPAALPEQEAVSGVPIEEARGTAEATSDDGDLCPIPVPGGVPAPLCCALPTKVVERLFRRIADGEQRHLVAFELSRAVQEAALVLDGLGQPHEGNARELMQQWWERNRRDGESDGDLEHLLGKHWGTPGEPGMSAEATRTKLTSWAVEEGHWRRKAGKGNGFGGKGKAAKSKPRRLTHDRAMAALEKCVRVLALRDRNTIRRRARLLKVVNALGLKGSVGKDDVAQMVIEAKEQGMGRTFEVLDHAAREELGEIEVRWVVKGLLAAEDMTIIGGRPKVGKSRLAIALAASIINGTGFLDFPAPEESRPVLLITDDQADGDTASMMRAVGIWDHPEVFWSRHLRLTERDIEALLAAIRAHPGAVVIVDSLRSITRSLQCGENDPELGGYLYDLKAAVIEAGGTLVLIHHCNKSTEGTGVEALSGHSAISGAANTILTMHYVTDERDRPMKDVPQRRLAVTGRSVRDADVVIEFAGAGGFTQTGAWAEWKKKQWQDAKKDKSAGAALKKLTSLQFFLLDGLHKQPSKWFSVQDLVEMREVDWDGPQCGEAKKVRRAMSKLLELGYVEKDRPANEVLYHYAKDAVMPGQEPDYGLNRFDSDDDDLEDAA